MTIKTLTKAPYFSVFHWTLDGKVRRNLAENFLQVSVISGQASMRVGEKSFEIQKGEHFIIPQGVDTYELEGEAELIVSHV